MARPFRLIDSSRQQVRSLVVRSGVMRHRPVRLCVQVTAHMFTRDANHLAAGVAYYAIFGVFPFLLGMMVISGLFLQAEVLQAKMLEFAIGNLPGSDHLIASNIVFIKVHRGELIIIAILGVLWSSSSVYGAIDRAVNRAWGNYRGQPFHVHRIEHILFLLSFGLYFFFWLAVTSFAQILLDLDLQTTWHAALKESNFFNVLIRSSSWTVTAVGFLLIYRYLPNCNVRWNYVWLGTLSASFLFEIGKELFSIYLLHYGTYDILYGSIASTIVFLFWVYVSALILSLGAEICSTFQQIYYPDEEINRTGAW